MKRSRSDAQPVKQIRAFNHFVAAFAGKPEDQMRANAQPARVCACEGVDIVGQVMAAIDSARRIAFFQSVDVIAGIAGALKVADERVGAVAPVNRRGGFFELCGHRHARLVYSLCVVGVMAVNTSPHGDATIAIGPGENRAAGRSCRPLGIVVTQQAIEETVALATPKVVKVGGEVHRLDKKWLTKWR